MSRLYTRPAEKAVQKEPAEDSTTWEDSMGTRRGDASGLSTKPKCLRSTMADSSLVKRLSSNRQNQSAFVLAGIGALNTLIYWLVFTRPYGLTEYYRRPLLNLHDLTRHEPLANWRLLGAFLVLGLLYWMGWRTARHARGRSAWAAVVGGALMSGTVLLLLYPFDAADIFDNIMHGRVLGVHGANPFQQPASSFKGDPFYRYVAWQTVTSAYGPGWEILAGGAARLAGDDVVTNVLMFKLLGGAFLAASVIIVADILRLMAPERVLAGILLLAWNPVILYETLGHGHNDTAMVFWILVACWTLLRRRYTLTVLALVTGALFKFIPLLMVPAAGLVALRELPNARARGRFLLVTGGAAVALVGLAYLPFWHGIETLDIVRRQKLFTTSLPTVPYVALALELGVERSASIVSRVAAVLTLAFSLFQGLRAWRDPTWLSFPKAAFGTLMLYLLLTCLWFQPWYAVWPLGIAAILPPGHASRLGVLFSFSSLSKPLILGPMWLWRRPLPSGVWRELRLGPFVLAVPWAYALFGIWHTRHRRRVGKSLQESTDT